MKAYSNTKGFMPEYEALISRYYSNIAEQGGARGTEPCGRGVNSCRAACWGCSALAASVWPCRATAGGGGRGDDPETLPDGSASKDMITPQTDQAVKNGLAFLASHRNRNGSFGTNGYTGNVAVTSLGALAFMAAGNQPNRGPYGRIVTDALRFVLSQENRDRVHPGFLHNPDGTPHGPMYGHGFGTLFLAEVSGMVQEPALRDDVDAKLHRAVKLILNSQNSEGGWRYDPDGREADISVTICQIMALRAARNVGVTVPKVQGRSLRPVRHGLPGPHGAGISAIRKQGGGGAGPEAFARTAAGVVALYSAGYYLNTDATQIKDGVEQRRRDAVDGIKHGLDFMRRNRPVGGPMNPARHPLLLRPLLRHAGDVGGGRRLLEGMVPVHPRRAGRPPVQRRLLGGRHLQPLRHGHGLHHPPGPQQLPAHPATMRRFTDIRRRRAGGVSPLMTVHQGAYAPRSPWCWRSACAVVARADDAPPSSSFTPPTASPSKASCANRPRLVRPRRRRRRGTAPTC